MNIYLSEKTKAQIAEAKKSGKPKVIDCGGGVEVRFDGNKITAWDVNNNRRAKIMNT